LSQINIFRSNAKFRYQNVTQADLDAVYDTNMFRVRTLNGKVFGTIEDVDG
jgi:hypothetical protein